MGKKEAIKTLKKATELSPDDPVIIDHLGDAYVKDGRKKAAKEMYLKAKTDEDRRSLIKQGTLEAYRVVNSNPDNLKTTQNLILPTTVIVNIHGSASRAEAWGYINRGEVEVDIKPTFSTSGGDSLIEYWPNGFGSFGMISYSSSSVPELKLKPGAAIVGRKFSQNSTYPGLGMEWTGHRLPGNSNFNTSTNRYDLATYELIVTYTGLVENPKTKFLNISLNANVSGAEETWYVKTLSEGGPSGVWNAALNADGNPNNSGSAGLINKMELQTNNNTYQI